MQVFAVQIMEGDTLPSKIKILRLNLLANTERRTFEGCLLDTRVGLTSPFVGEGDRVIQVQAGVGEPAGIMDRLPAILQDRHDLRGREIRVDLLDQGGRGRDE